MSFFSNLSWTKWSSKPAARRVKAARSALSMVVEPLEARQVPAGTPIIIDDFPMPQGPLVLTGPGTVFDSLEAANVLGGERDMAIFSQADQSGGTTTLTVDSGFLTLVQDANVFAYGGLSYDGVDNNMDVNFEGLGGIDLTQGGEQNALRIDVASNAADTQMGIKVWTKQGFASIFAFTVAASDTPQSYVIAYENFAPSDEAEQADFTSVGAISVIFGTALFTTPSIVLDTIQTTSLLNATETVALTGDVDGNGLVNPGDTLTYTVTISDLENLGEVSFDDVSFANLAPANSTLVAGSVTTTQGTVTSGNTAGDTSIGVDVGQILPGSENNVTITFQVKVNAPLESSILRITSQGTVTVGQLGTFLTDDPTVDGYEDATSIAVDLPLIEGTWFINGQSTHVLQRGTVVTFINEFGAYAEGRIISSGTLIADEWEGGLEGTFNALGITWENGTAWTRPELTSFSDLGSEWLMDSTSLRTHAQRLPLDPAELLLTNEFGDVSRARFISETELIASDWGELKGTYDPEELTITWDNGTRWVSPNGPQVRDVSGAYLFEGQWAQIRQTGSQLTLVDELGNVSSGQLNEEGTQITANAFGITGTIDQNGNISWSDGTTWTKTTFDPPALSHNWIIDAISTTELDPNDGGLWLVNERGETSRGVIVSNVLVYAVDWMVYGDLATEGENNQVVINWRNNTQWRAVDAEVDELFADLFNPFFQFPIPS